MPAWLKRLWKLDVSLARWMGVPDHLFTLSAWAYLSEQEGGPGKFTRPVIDWLFFWQKDHCKNAYLKEIS